MATITTSILPPPVQKYYDNVLLSTPDPGTIHTNAAMKKSLKGKSGQTIRMERYHQLSTAPVPLGNSGITPPGQLLSSVFIDAKVEFYGTFVKINEQVELTSQSPVLNQAAIRLGQSMRMTEDQLMRDMLATTASVSFATGGVNGDTPTEIALSDIQDVVKTLLSNSATYMKPSIDGSNKFGTAPVASTYMALAHSDLSATFSNLNDFTRVHQYGSQTDIQASEWGAVDAVRVFLSPVGSVTANASGAGEDVFNTFICGSESHAQVALDNYKSDFVYNDGLDPLKLNKYAGWKFSEAPVITNDAWIINLKSTLA